MLSTAAIWNSGVALEGRLASTRPAIGRTSTEPRSAVIPSASRMSSYSLSAAAPHPEGQISLARTPNAHTDQPFASTTIARVGMAERLGGGPRQGGGSAEMSVCPPAFEGRFASSPGVMFLGHVPARVALRCRQAKRNVVPGPGTNGFYRRCYGARIFSIRASVSSIACLVRCAAPRMTSRVTTDCAVMSHVSRNQLTLGCDGVILHGSPPQELQPIVEEYRRSTPTTN